MSKSITLDRKREIDDYITLIQKRIENLIFHKMSIQKKAEIHTQLKTIFRLIYDSVYHEMGLTHVKVSCDV